MSPHRTLRLNPAWLAAALVVVLLTAAACASSQTLERADAHAGNGEWDMAIAFYQQRLKEDPGDQESRRKLLLARSSAAGFHRSQGNKLFAAGDLANANLEMELAVRLDPVNQAALIDLRRITEAIAEAEALDARTETDIEKAISSAAAAPSPVPQLEHSAVGEMTFDYRRARIKEIYRAMARLGQINVLFDPDLDNEPTSFFLGRVDYLRAWDVLTMTQRHFYRVLGPNTILVAPDNQQMRRQYDPQVMRTFYLSNGDAEQISTALQTILQARNVVPVPSLNVVTIRDTAAVVDMAARLVRSLDKAGGEVLLQVEIFEVNRGVMNEWGLSLSDFSTTASIAQGDNGISFDGLSALTNQDVFITVPSLKYQFLKETANFKLVAQPQLRASDGQQSQLLVGEQRPVVTTTFNPQSTVGGSVVPVSSVEYRDVGIVIDATPRVHHDGTITLQLGIQVTAVQENESGAQDQPVFTARTLTTTLRLKEGETNLLAGLLRDDERQIRTGFPILSDIPILRDLFGKTTTEVVQTDLVLSITPYIVRMADITEEDLEAVYVGTEANMSGGSGGGRRNNNRRGRGGGDQGDEDDEARDATPISVQVQPADQVAGVGQRLSIDVRADGDGEVNNVGMRVSFNPQVLRFVEAREGGLLGSDGAETSFQTSGSAQGAVAVGIGRVGNVGGVRASGTLVTLEFECIGAGESGIDVISAALRDAGGRPLPVEFSQGSVRVNGD